ncbi:hypothetical protein HYV81_06065 [Candidatus Woesearchaeota archaeon]|nr:hypothetical protein [Candidatus Woesearchaeota archaeon]
MRTIELRLNEPVMHGAPQELQPREQYYETGRLFSIREITGNDIASSPLRDIRALRADIVHNPDRIILVRNLSTGLMEPLIVNDAGTMYWRGAPENAPTHEVSYAALQLEDAVELRGPAGRQYTKFLDNSDMRKEIVIASPGSIQKFVAGNDMLFFMSSVDTHAKYPMCTKVFPAIREPV